MFFKCYIIFLLTIELVLSSALDNYTIIIIPIPKSSRTNAIRSKRIDIEQYEEPTEMPDIDNFDYMKEREDILRESEDFNKKKNDILRFVEKSKEKDENTNKFDVEDILKESENLNKEKNDILRFAEKGYTADKSVNKFDVDSEEFVREDVVDDVESLVGDNKIVGGTEVDINLYPYHVAYGSNCGGAIIAASWVMTAGHCGKKPFIRAGSKYMNEGHKHMVKNSYIHPMWGAKNKEHPFDFDFQVVELADQLKFGDNIQPIKIAKIEDMIIGKVITVTGWGNTKENGPYSNVLRAVRVPIISKEHCQNVPFPYFRGGLTMRMFCAGYPEGKKDACQGDSGGPAVAYDRLLGMVSFGYGCATPGSFGVYSKVAKVRPWIEEITGLTLD